MHVYNAPPYVHAHTTCVKRNVSLLKLSTVLYYMYNVHSITYQSMLAVMVGRCQDVVVFG